MKSDNTGDYITMAKAVRRAGITEHALRKFEKAWLERFKSPLPLPENHLGHRLFNEAWIAWLKEAVPMHQSGWSLLSLRLELRPPSLQKLKLAGPAPAGVSASWSPDL